MKVGDRVLFTSYAGETFKVGDEELLLMREEDILAVIETRSRPSVEPRRQSRRPAR